MAFLWIAVERLSSPAILGACRWGSAYCSWRILSQCRSSTRWLVQSSPVYAPSRRQEIEITKSTFVGLYVAVLIAVVVIVDLLIFRNRFWERLMVNIGVVLVFAAFYLRFLKNP
jgi:hypothetical protein